jgi:porin
MRTRLKNLGVTPTASYAAAWFGAASGPGTKPTYAGQLTGAVHVELDKSFGAWRGLSFYASGVWASQTGADSFLNTNLLAVNALAAGSSGWLTEMYVQQTALDGQLTVAAGRLGPAVTFATLPVLANYLNAAFAASPAAPRINDPAFGAPPPNSQWGLQATYAIDRRWQVAAGIFNNNPDSAAGAKHGTDFRWRQGNTGALVVAEVSYLHQQAAGARGLPGQYTLGGFHDGNRFSELATGATVDGAWNIYALAQQQVTRDGGAGSARGLTVWGGVSYAGNERVNPVPLGAGAGASWQGVVAGRPNDVASAGWFYGKVSDAVPGASAGQAVELNYQCAITGAVALTGDFQYLWRLNGLPSPGAAVFGLQLSLTF